MIRRLVVAGVLAVALALVPAQSASAALGSLVPNLTDSLLKSTQTATTQLSCVTGGECGVLEYLSDVVCPPTQQLAADTQEVPLVGGVTQTTADVVCTLALIEFEFRTVYRRPNGTEVVRRTRAYLNAPASLNVDDDLAPELVGTVNAVTPARIDIRVEKALLAEPMIPVKVELIAKDPGNVQSNRRIAFGYDTRESFAPQKFKSTLQVLKTGDPTHLSLDMFLSGQPSKMALIGELFEEPALDVRKDPIKGRITYEPTPTYTGYELQFGSTRQWVTHKTNGLTKVDVEARIVRGADEKRVTGVLDDTEGFVQLRHDVTGTDQRTLVYDAHARIDKIGISYEDRQLDMLEQKVLLNLLDVPTGFTVHQTGARAGDLTTSGGPFGAIELGIANGEPQFLPDDGYFFYKKTATLSNIALRVPGLEAAQVDGEEPYLLKATLAPGPFRVLVDEPDRDIEAKVLDLPHEIELKLNPTEGTANYRGSAPIDLITVDATSSTPFFAEADEIHARLKGIPTALDIGFKQDGDKVRLSATNPDDPADPIDEIQVLASDGTVVGLPAGASGAIYRDVPGQYAVFARVFGLQLVEFDPTPITARAITAGGKVFTVDARVDIGNPQPLEVDATIDKLPGDVGVKVHDTATGKDVEYRANAPIDSLDVEIANLPDFIGRADGARVKLEGIPTAQDISFSHKPDDSVRFSATNPHNPGDAVDMIEVFASDGPAASLPAGESGAIYRDIPSEYVIFARVFGLQLVEFDPDPVTAHVITAGGKVFTVESLIDIGNAQPLDVEARIDKLPGDLAVKMTETATGRDVEYRANAPIAQLDVAVRDLPGVVAEAEDLFVTLKGIPAKLDVGVEQDAGGGVEFTAVNPDDANDPVDEIEVLARAGGAFASLPAGQSGAIYRDLTNEFVIFARVFGLQLVSFDPDPAAFHVITSGGHVFTVEGRLQPGGGDPIEVDATIDQLPADVEGRMVDLFGLGKQFRYRANAPIGHLTATVKGVELLEGADNLYVDILDIPTSVDVNLWDTKTFPSLPVFEAIAPDGVGKIEGQLTDDGNLHAFPAERDGLVFRDTQADYMIAGKISGLKSAKATLEPTMKFEFDVDPARSKPFDATVRTQGDGVLDPVLRHDGMIDKLQPNTKLEIKSGDVQEIDYSAGGSIDEITYETDAIPGVPLLSARVRDLPPVLKACFGSGSTADGCTRRPGGYPQDSGKHSVAVSFDDQGTAAGNPTRVNVFVCLKPRNGNDCDLAGDWPDKFALVGGPPGSEGEGMAIERLDMDVFAERCTGLLHCGNIFVNTENRPFGAGLHYFEREVSPGLDLDARLQFGHGSTADNRLVRWFDEPIGPAASADEKYGSMFCAPGSNGPIKLGPGEIANFADGDGDFLC